MTDYTRISIVRPSAKPAAIMVVLADSGLKLGPRTEALGIGDVVAAAAVAGRFKGKLHSTLDILAPAVDGVDRIIVLGVGVAGDLGEKAWLELGGDAMGALAGSGAVTVMLERPDGEPVAPDMAAQFALGMKLRGYVFDDYLTGANATDSQDRTIARIRIAVADSGKAKTAWESAEAVGEGVLLARDLVNLPPNILGPVEFADRAKELSRLGVDVEVMTEAQMKRKNMRALLGVAQGSSRPPRLVVMRWNGGKEGDAPVAFVGKGVVFDTGGISLKPGQGMQDMKGDMAGAAAVTGLMAALAGRKAKANVIGVIGLVENMPDGNAQRPGDIVTAMTGRTIEIINTDAEGRLVLADAVAHTERTFKPRLMVDLATLTGAIIVALGHHYAGMFASDDNLAETLAAAGQATGERVWRMPLDDAYDRSINSQFANVKNAGARDAGSITAAHFIKRFVEDTPWAHLDIAGTGFGSPQTAVNRSWASGFGVRLLDRFVADHHE